MHRKSGDLVSITIALGLTVLFVGETLARWPSPSRLHTFQIEYINPFGPLHKLK